MTHRIVKVRNEQRGSEGYRVQGLNPQSRPGDVIVGHHVALDFDALAPVQSAPRHRKLDTYFAQAEKAGFAL